MLDRALLDAEAAKVDTPIEVWHWYVTHEQAQAEVYRAIQEGVDPERIGSMEGWNIEVRAVDGGRHYRKVARISPAACASSVAGMRGLLVEAMYLAEKRVREVKREIAWHRLHAC